MTRIKGVSSADAGLYTKIACFFSRRAMASLAGASPERGIEPIEVYAHLPGLLKGVAKLEMAAGKLDGLDTRLQLLATLKAATLTHCAYCIDLGSQISRRSGLSDDELLALPFYRSSPHFSDVDRVVLDYATGMCQTPVAVSEDLFLRLREHFDDKQIVELTFLIALQNLRGRFNHALEVESAGFSEGRVCAIPAPALVAD